MTRTVIHFVDSTIYGGTEQALLHLLARIDRNRWKPIVLHHPEPGIAPFLEEARRLNVKTRVVRRMQGTGAISGLPQFLYTLRQEQPTIFHAHLNWLLSCKFGLLAAALSRVPVVIATLQQFLLAPWKKNIYFQKQLISAGVDQYIAVSNAVAQQLSNSFGIPSDKVKVVYNCIPFAQFDRPGNHALKKTLSQGTERPLVLTVARLDEQKGHKFLLEAIRQVPEGIFVLAGDGPKRAALETQALDLGIADRVLFLGHRPDIPDLLASCDLFVLPSLYEGLPLSILEAMAAGKAVVATAVGGTPEAVLDGITGLLVPPGSPEALANAIRKVLSHLELACKMGSAGKARIREEFSVETMVNDVYQTYEDLLNRHSGKHGNH
jgi:glycosyltransferase involved in cell wall biosynthesis